MASELKITIGANFAKGSLATFQRTFASDLARDVAGSNTTYGTQLIGTSAEALNLGEIGTAGYLLIKNLDPTNFVKIRNGSSGTDVVKLKPGDPACFRINGTPYLIADTAACAVEYWLIED